jgi:hypothetical protein
MKRFTLVALALCGLAALLLTPSISRHRVDAAKAPELTECEKTRLKYAPQIAAFRATYMTGAFNAPAAWGDMAQSTEAIARLKFQELTPDQRRAVWQAKFDQLDVSDYTDTQQGVIREFVSNLKTKKYDGTDNNASDKPLIERAKANFKKSELVDLFASLKATGSVMQKAAGKLPEPCKCNGSTWGGLDDFCGTWNPGDKCYVDGFCIWAGIGCGWGWSAVCDGVCRPA